MEIFFRRSTRYGVPGQCNRTYVYFAGMGNRIRFVSVIRIVVVKDILRKCGVGEI